MGAKNGILFKTAVSLEEAGKIQIVALDKTGTITKGEPQVTDMVPAKGISEEELLGYAYALEKKSEHPLAKAIIAKSRREKIVLQKVSDFQALPGNGLRAALNSDVLTGGNMKFISNETSVSPELMKQADHEVLFHTPYIICNDWMMRQLVEVCEGEKEIRMMTNSVANNGNPFGAMDYQKNKEKIRDTGVGILEYDKGVS